MPHSVAIVDDDPLVRRELVRAVHACNDLVLIGEAGDLPEAFGLMQSNQVDVLLVDLDLPSGSGIDLIRHASVALPSCSIMVLTVFGDERNVLACLDAGASGYLLKSTHCADIAEHILALCAGGSPISPTIARGLLTRLKQSTPTDRPLDLSHQEYSVLSLSAKGYTYEEVADLLMLSSHTVKTYVKRIYRKLQVNSKTAAVYEARKLRWLDD
jgi:DNA-binding NarL/FixJ family response regulator